MRSGELGRCPTCGQPLGLDAEKLYALLAHGVPHREVYRAADGSWWVTYGGGMTTEQAVMALVNERRVCPRYNNLPQEVFHVGRTIDMDATLAFRKGRPRKD